MKLNFKDKTLKKYSFRDLEYGLKLLNTELELIDVDMKILKKYDISPYEISSCKAKAIVPINAKIRIIETELSERLLTGNDDGMLERELLGVNV